MYHSNTGQLQLLVHNWTYKAFTPANWRRWPLELPSQLPRHIVSHSCIGWHQWCLRHHCWYSLQRDLPHSCHLYDGGESETSKAGKCTVHYVHEMLVFNNIFSVKNTPLVDEASITWRLEKSVTFANSTRLTFHLITTEDVLGLWAYMIGSWRLVGVLATSIGKLNV